MEFEKIVHAEPAFDKRNGDPKKNYGIHGVNLRFVLKGKLGAVQFLVYTGWHLPHVTDELINKCNPVSTGYRHCSMRPMAADVGYHSYHPMYDEQPQMSESCEYLDGKPCYYDGSGLHAEKVFNEVFVTKGTDGLWEYMEKYYNDVFSSTSDTDEADNTKTNTESAKSVEKSD